MDMVGEPADSGQVILVPSMESVGTNFSSKTAGVGDSTRLRHFSCVWSTRVQSAAPYKVP